MRVLSQDRLALQDLNIRVSDTHRLMFAIDQPNLNATFARRNRTPVGARPSARWPQNLGFALRLITSLIASQHETDVSENEEIARLAALLQVGILNSVRSTAR